MKIGNKLHSLRVEKGFTPIAVAEKVEVSLSTYRRFEADKSFPDLPTLEKLANIYDKHFMELLPEEMVINNHPTGDNSNNGFIINNYLSEKLIEQYEERIKEKDKRLEEKEMDIIFLKQEIERLKNL